MKKGNKLCLTTSCSEVMLAICQCIILFHILHEVANYYDVLQHLAIKAGQWIRAVVIWIITLAFLENCRHIGCFQLSGTVPV